MAKNLTRFILLALVLGIIAGWTINYAIDDGSAAADERLKSIAEYLSIVTALFLRLIKMIIAPLVFSTLVAGIAHMGDTAALGRIAFRSIGWFILASLVSLTLGLILVTALDPGVGLNRVAWYDGDNGEIADICAFSSSPSRVVGADGVSYAVQRAWSNRRGACVAGP